MRSLTENELESLAAGIQTLGKAEEPSSFILGAGIGAITAALALREDIEGILIGALVGGIISSVFIPAYVPSKNT